MASVASRYVFLEPQCWSLVLVFLLLSQAPGIADNVSFEPPFEEYDFSGNKLVNSNWKNHGTTVVNKNFVRLTPDRQSKKGALWSRSPLTTDGLHAILKFRISGKGKNFFGDGLAMWIVSDGDYVEGDLHGFVEKFHGVGIIFDTFKNTEHLSHHRDVTVLLNDGEKSFEVMTEEILGCNTNLRYSAERADFSVTDSTRAKISLSEGKLVIEIDSKNTGDWMPCVDIDNIPFKDDWIKESHVGFTGTTGQLADNHDIISFHAFSDHVSLNAIDEIENRKHFELRDKAFSDATVSTLEEAINTLISKQTYMDHHFEHELVSVEDHLKNLQGKLGQRDSLDERLSEIEDRVQSNEMQNFVTDNLKRLELDLQQSIDRKIQNLYAEIHAVTELSSRIDGKTMSWYWPFLAVIFFQVCAALGAYIFYKNLKKKHFL